MLKSTIQANKTNNRSSTQEVAFGFQLLLDLYDCRPGTCDDLTLCYQFLDEIVDYLGMEKQAPPNIFRTDALRFPDKAGLSAISFAAKLADCDPTVVVRSHHAEEGYVNIDVVELSDDEIEFLCEKVRNLL